MPRETNRVSLRLPAPSQPRWNRPLSRSLHIAAVTQIGRVLTSTPPDDALT
jgi:hypothetical protein